jgi:hypothetical protein
VDPAALVDTAAQRFIDGADAPFLSCFNDDAKVYWEPTVARNPIVSSRAALGEWLARLRRDHPQLTASMAKPTAHGERAVVCELVIDADAAGVWRVALAVVTTDDLISEVRAFWGRDAAVEWLAQLW